MLLSELLESQHALTESPERQIGLQVLTGIVMNSLARQITYHLEKRHREYSSSFEPEIWDCAATTIDTAFPNRKGLSKLPKKIQDFVKASKSLRIAIAQENGTHYGHFLKRRYGQAEIMLFFDEAKFSSVRDALGRGAGIFYVVMEFLKERATVLLHELVHAYDDWASNGRYDANDRSKTYHAIAKSTDHPDRHNLYLNQPLEINARFAQSLSDLYSERNKTWKDFVSKFTWNFPGWRLIPDNEKRRLLVRLAAFYNQNRKDPPMDLTAKVKDLQDKIEERTGAKLLLHYSKSTDAIAISYIPTNDTAIKGLITKLVCRVADIYRKVVITGERIPHDVLIANGFVRNRGRNKDFRISEPYYRPVMRQEAAGLRVAA